MNPALGKNVRPHTVHVQHVHGQVYRVNKTSWPNLQTGSGSRSVVAHDINEIVIMLRLTIIIKRSNIRFYHQEATKAPTIRFANTKVRRANELKRHHESTPRAVTEFHDPRRTFEPFPFKVTEDNKAECLRRKITPLFDVPYEEQLASKESFCRNALRLLGQELFKSGTPVRLDVKRLPCTVNPIVRSPQLTKYRNKDEFSIWRGLDGETITVGHNIFPISKHGDTVSVEPTGCEVMRDETILATKFFNQFLLERAKLPISYDIGTQGGWRRIMVRINVDGELMLIGVINPRGLRVGEVLNDRDSFKNFMVKRCSEADLKLASLYYQPCPHNSCRHKDVPFELLYGEKTIVESIGDYKIHISPESFVHNSSKGAEVLYATLRSMLKDCFIPDDGHRPIILDANCGAGILSLNLSSLAETVIGIDSSPQSVDDAKLNAELNNVRNVEFVNSDTEIVLGRILEKFSSSKRDIIVVCDVPNRGLHRNVVEVLRHSRDVNKIVLTVPKIDSPRIMDDVASLCSRHKAKSLPPFALILATPVDTCPHIEQFQTILALERLPV